LNSVVYRQKLHQSNLSGYSGIDLNGVVFETTTPFLVFSIEIQSNDLSYHQEYSKRQEIVYRLIKHLHNEGLGYRKISQKLNSWGIKTQRGKQWFNTSVSSVLKKKRLRDNRIKDVRNQVFEPVISKMRVVYYTFD